MPETRQGGRKPASAATSRQLYDGCNTPLPPSLPASPSRPSPDDSDSETESTTTPAGEPPSDEVAGKMNSLTPVESCPHTPSSSYPVTTDMPTDASIAVPQPVPPAPEVVPPPAAPSAGPSTCSQAAPSTSITANVSTYASAIASAPAINPAAAAPGSAQHPTTPAKNFVICMSSVDNSRAFMYPARLRQALEESIFAGKYIEGSQQVTGGGFGVRFEVPNLGVLPQAPESVTRLGEWEVKCWVIDPDPSCRYTYGRIYPIHPNVTDEALAASIKVMWGSQSPIIRVSRLPPLRGNDGEQTPNLAVRLKFKGPLPDKVTVDQISYRVIPHTLPVLQCYRCLSYGHGKAACRGQTKCHTCSGPHDASGCTRAPSCFYCGATHRPTSRFCPANLAAADIQQQYQEGKISYAQEKQKLRDIKPGFFQRTGTGERIPTRVPSVPAASAPRRTDTQPQALPTPSAPPLTEESHPQVPATDTHPAPSCPVPSETASTTNPEAEAPHPHTDPSLCGPINTRRSLPPSTPTHTLTPHSLQLHRFLYSRPHQETKLPPHTPALLLPLRAPAKNSPPQTPTLLKSTPCNNTLSEILSLSHHHLPLSCLYLLTLAALSHGPNSQKTSVSPLPQHSSHTKNSTTKNKHPQKTPHGPP